MSIKDKARTAILNFLRIQPAPNQRIDLQESLGLATDIIQNKIWYRGDPSELSQFYKQIGTSADDTISTRFWAQVPEVGSLRKAHAGLPAVMVDVLTQIIKADMGDIKFDGSEALERWQGVAKENEFPALVGKAITETLVTGDGAFKVLIDHDVSPHPILEFYAADCVEYETRCGRIDAIVFGSSRIGENGEKYTLKERYAKGSVLYRLYDKDGKECDLSLVPELRQLEEVSFDGNFMLAIPLRFFASTRWPMRGRSIYSSKIDDFDILDEIVSQWLDAIRAGRVMRYIPDALVPRDPGDGSLVPLSYFQSNFVITQSDNRENAQNKLEMQQAEIRYEAFLASYTAAVDRCMQGIMSPATLGIDVGKMSSAEAQREKKDITGYTRNAITDELEKILPKVVSIMLMADDLMQEKAPGKYEPSVSFGEYGAPDLDARVETLSKASAAGIMSVEAVVEKLWGSSKEDNWKEQEIKRIKILKGIEETNPPSVGDELTEDELNELP